MFDFKNLIIRYLQDDIKRLKEDDCEISDSEAIDILKVIAHRPLSKAQACIFLNIRRSRFDALVREHVIPKGKKRIGYNELVWYEDELELVKHKNKRKYDS